MDVSARGITRWVWYIDVGVLEQRKEPRAVFPAFGGEEAGGDREYLGELVADHAEEYPREWKFNSALRGREGGASAFHVGGGTSASLSGELSLSTY